MRKRILAVFILLFSLSVSSPAYASTDVPQAVLNAAKSVVRIEVTTPDGLTSGSGFIISNETDTYIATNYHVVEENVNAISVWAGQTQKIAASVAASDDQRDLAVLKLEQHIEGAPLPFAEKASQGNSVYAIGFPGAADYLSGTQAHTSDQATITDGLISSVRTAQAVENGPEIRILQISAPINAGNSGGPLLNAKGEVFGINSYGVMDAQGIYGAIDISELNTVLKGMNIPLAVKTEANPAAPWYLWGVIGLAGLAVIAVITVILPKKIRSKSKALPLDAYLQRLNRRLDPACAVSMMMPLALQIRDKHNQGAVYLKLFPAHIIVDKSGCKLNPATAQDTFLYPEFASPEQLQGKLSGPRSDTYSFCALLRYMICKSPQAVVVDNADFAPDNQQAEEPAELAALNEILDKGMAEDPSRRFASMQELILELSPFNRGIAAYALQPFGKEKSEKVKVEKQRKLKKHRSKKFKIVFAVITVFVLAVVYFGGNLLLAYTSMKKQDFKSADAYLGNTLFLGGIFKDMRAYIDAGVLLTDKNYDGAAAAFQAMPGYEKASELSQEAQYQKAASLASNGKFDDAIAVYKSLGDYRDSATMIYNTLFRKGSYLLTNDHAYTDALAIFNELINAGFSQAKDMISETYYQWGNDYLNQQDYANAYKTLSQLQKYKDSEKLLGQLKDVLYNLAVDYYRTGQYSTAKDHFNLLGNYLRSKDYLVLIAVHDIKHPFDKLINNSTLWEEFISVVGFEDSANLIEKNNIILNNYLLGRWVNESYYAEFAKGDKTIISVMESNIPGENYDHFLAICDGAFDFFYNSVRESFGYKILTGDSFILYSYITGKSYTLKRS